MLHDAFAHLKGQVQPGKSRIALLEPVDDPQGVQVMVEALAKAPHHGVELLLAGVGKWRMPDVVRQRQRFGQILVERQRAGYGARDLRHLNRMGQQVAEMIGKSGGKDLGLVLQPPEGAGVNDTIAIALEFVAIGMRKLGITAAAAPLDGEAQGGEPAAHCCGRSPSTLSATRLMAGRAVRSGSSSLRASWGRVGAINCARSMVASSFDTKSVGLPISSRSRVSPSLSLPSPA